VSTRRTARPVPGRRIPGALPAARMAARGGPRAALEVADAPRDGTLGQIEACKRALLLTYRRDGRPVPTPVWAAASDGLLYVRTEASSGKVKRLRRDPRLLVAPCTVRGVPLGAPLTALGRVLETSSEQARAERTLAGRYGLGRELFELAMDAMRVDMTYLELRPSPWP
jgi:PPOX class probable F420-dependent enzyme